VDGVGVKEGQGIWKATDSVENGREGRRIGKECAYQGEKDLWGCGQTRRALVDPLETIERLLLRLG